MLPTATIVFREIIEIALVVGIVMAATRGMSGRLYVVLAGIGLGVIGAGIIAFFTEAISNAIDGMGQEIFNAAIMFTAVVLLSWTVLWMQKHGREMAKNISDTGKEVLEGKKSLNVLIVIVALATFREGAEIVLFTYGMMASEQYTIASIASGATLGLIGGTIVGGMLYFGLLKAAQKHLFTVTSWLLILLSAGMAAQGARFLVSADVLSPIKDELWDTSSLVSGHSLFGEILGVLVGYTPNPSGIELIFYSAVIITVGGTYFLSNRASKMVQAKS